jgi:general L-amino acid transport system substrate-binding protein
MTYDGQGFIVRKDSGVKKLTDLDGATICTSQGSTMEINTTDYFRKNNLKLELITYKSVPEAFSAYMAKRCDSMTAGALGLVANSQKLADPENHIILPERISMEPIGPLVAQGQSRWGDAVRWILNALIAAEELGVTQANVDEQRKSSNNPQVKRLLGVTGDLGQTLGLSNDWAYNVIKAVGNYGEIFDRHLGPNTRLKIDRGLNALWNNGGLLMSPPIR